MSGVRGHHRAWILCGALAAVTGCDDGAGGEDAAAETSDGPGGKGDDLGEAAAGCDGQTGTRLELCEEILARRGVRPRFLQSYANGDTHAQQQLIDQVQDAVAWVNKSRSGIHRITELEVLTNILVEGGNTLLDAPPNGSPAASSLSWSVDWFNHFGLDKSYPKIADDLGFAPFDMDRYSDGWESNLQTFHPVVVRELRCAHAEKLLWDSGCEQLCQPPPECQEVGVNGDEVREEFDRERYTSRSQDSCTPQPTMNWAPLDASVYAAAGLWAERKSSAISFLQSKGVSLSSSDQDNIFFWTTVFFNSCNPEEKWEAYGSVLQPEAFDGVDDWGVQMTNARYHASWRTATYEWFDGLGISP